METRSINPELEPHLSFSIKDHPQLGSGYQLCEKTGTVYFSHAHSKTSYEEDYFIEEYTSQYGLSYMEDEIHLRHLAKQRLKIMATYIKPVSDLLEIGCATGFFLDEASKLGYRTKGIEVSEYASLYARRKLGLDVLTTSFLSYCIKNDINNTFDAICAFYFLEHIAEQKSIFSKIATSLKPGGILCFALPSLYGPLFRHNLPKWLSSHPCDHFVDYAPQSLKRVLSLYGLSLVKIWPASFHPERLKYIGYIWKRQPMASLYQNYAKMFCYGDTMEGIAIKT